LCFVFKIENQDQNFIHAYILIIDDVDLCYSDQRAIEQWETKLDLPLTQLLTPLGKQRMQDLGKRYAKRLSNFLKNLKLADVYVQATEKNRTQDSAIAYINGMFENWEEKPKFSVEKNEDYLLSFYEVCQKYITVN
jgi:hypothetical protein